MKKVAIVSCYFQPNYGSMLQAYATQEILNFMGIPNETVNIDGFKQEIRKTKIKYFLSRITSKDVVMDKLGYVRLAVKKKLDRKFAYNLKLRNRRFYEFSQSHFNVSKKYSSISEIGLCASSYVAFLVGSDQLWLPSNIAADYYTLNFVPDATRKIAYATSFGVASLPKKQADAAKRFLPRINFLSVRELSGKQLIKTLTGLDAKIVCDPTLLLSKTQWNNLIVDRTIIKGKYIFCYFLGNNSLSRKCAEFLKKKTGYQIVALQQIDMYIKEDEVFGDKTPYSIDPADFVNLIRHAEFVCTDSFHGTVFSIINHKQFFTFRRFTKKTTMSTNNRMDSLLDILSLSNRIINTLDDFENIFQAPIRYNETDERLNIFRNESLEFLKSSLEGLD